MPNMRDHKNRIGALCLGAVIVISLMLAGCAAGDGRSLVSRAGFGSAAEPAAKASLENASARTELQQAGNDAKVRSEVIESLVARQSILPESGPYAMVAQSVLEASKGAAVAELRVARLKSEAKAKNWLPSVGPSVSLTSLGSVATGFLLEQAVFDNGQRKAERAFAAADVELAAVTLATDANDRVYKGLTNYVQVQKSQNLADLAESAVARMTEYDRIMAARVRGGLSDGSERSVIAQKLGEMQALLVDDRNAAASAAADLAAMAEASLTDVTGLQDLPIDSAIPEPLSVLQSRSEGAQLAAQAQIERANHRPGIKATTSLVQGDLLGGLRLGTGELLGFGTKADLAALDATGDVVKRRTDEAADEANRRIVDLNQRIAALTSREVEGSSVLTQTAASLDQFERQYKVGRRPLLDLVGMFETYAKLQRDHAALKYDIAFLRLEIARQRGVLVDGTNL